MMIHEIEVLAVRINQYHTPKNQINSVKVKSYDFNILLIASPDTLGRQIIAVYFSNKPFHLYDPPIDCHSDGNLLEFRNVPAEYFGVDGPRNAQVETN